MSIPGHSPMHVRIKHRDPSDETCILDAEKTCDTISISVNADTTMNIIGLNFLNGDTSKTWPVFGISNVVSFENELLDVGKPN